MTAAPLVIFVPADADPAYASDGVKEVVWGKTVRTTQGKSYRLREVSSRKDSKCATHETREPGGRMLLDKGESHFRPAATWHRKARSVTAARRMSERRARARSTSMAGRCFPERLPRRALSLG